MGLHSRSASLRSDQEVTQELTREAAKRLARKLVALLVERRVDALRREAERLSQNDQPDAAREARVTAAVLRAAIDAKGSRKALDAER